MAFLCGSPTLIILILQIYPNAKFILQKIEVLCGMSNKCQ